MRAPTTRTLLAAAAVVLSAATPLVTRAQEPAPAPAPGAPNVTGVGLTIYSTADPAGFDPQRFIAEQRQGYNPMMAWQVPGFGVVRDTRTLNLGEGRNVQRFTDVAQFIDPTTVNLVDLTAQGNPNQPGVAVLDQSFQFDLVSPEKIYEKFLDQKVTVNLPRGDNVEQVEGTLLSANQGRLVLQTRDGVRIVSATGDVQLGDLPQGLITRPTLQWTLLSPVAGPRTLRTTYQTDGLTWRADYNLIVNDDDTAADLGAWVTLMNLSGATYTDAQLKLIAGDVQRIQPPQPMRGEIMSSRAAVAMEMDAAGFEEKSFGEYHLYTLPRPVTLPDNSTQQIALFPTVSDVKVEKVLVYYGLPDDARYWVFPTPRTDRELGTQSNTKVDVYYRFDNKEESNLGIPLPKGKVRVFKLDQPAAAAGQPQPATGTLEFVGEDLIDHTPKNQQVLIKIGQSFDVTGARTQTNFRADFDRDWLEETIRIELKNAKPQPQKVVVRETLYRWTNWEIKNNTDDFTKVDSRTIHFDVEVPAEGSKTVEYTVRYTW